MLIATAFVVLAATLRVAAHDTEESNTTPGPLTIYTLSSPTACEPAQFTWSGGKGPYYLSIIPAGQPAGPAMQQFPVQDGNAMTWVVNMPPGTTFSSALKDSTGMMAYSDSQTVQSGPDTSCVDEGSSPMPVANAASTVASRVSSVVTTVKPAIAGSNVTSPSTGTATVVHAAGVSGAAGSGIGTSPSTTGVAPVNMPAKNAAGTTGGSFGLVGFLGFLGAALLG